MDRMSSQLSVSHSTTHTYAQEVIHSYNEARLVPADDPGADLPRVESRRLPKSEALQVHGLLGFDRRLV